MIFDPFDWYWLASNGGIYSSRKSSLVAENDADYKAWLGRGGIPSAWPVDTKGKQTDEALRETLAGWGIGFNLPDVLEFIIARVNAEAEVARSRYITPGAGQAMTYLQKVEEARALESDEAETPDPTKYPMLSAELALDDRTLREIGATVMEAYNQWLYLGAVIERLRLEAVTQIRSAETREAAETIANAIVWP